MNNNPNAQKLKFLFLAGLAIVAVTLVSVIAVSTVRSGQLRVESVDPENKGSIPPQGVVLVTFNRDVDTAAVSLEPETGFEASFAGKTITLVPYTKFNTGEYTFKITDAVAKDGRTMKEFTSTFTVAETSEQSDKNAEEARNFNLEERTSMKYPFLKDLYHDERAYTITYRIETTPYTHPIYNRVVYKDLTLLVQLRADVDWGPVRGQELTNELLKSKQKALDYIISRGLNPSEFVIKYTPDPEPSGETGL